MDYPELIAEITERSGDSAVAAKAKLYLTLAEAEINKALRIGGSEMSVGLTTDANGEVELPEDFSAIRMLVMAGREVSPVDLTAVTLPSHGQRGYAVRGNMLVTSWPSTDMTLYYYARIPPLDQVGTNWLIESDPDIYIYAMLQQVFLAKLDAEKALAAETVFNKLISARQRDDAIVRLGRKPYRAVGNVV